MVLLVRSTLRLVEARPRGSWRDPTGHQARWIDHQIRVSSDRYPRYSKIGPTASSIFMMGLMENVMYSE